MWKSVILTKRAENIRSKADFFCLKSLIGYTCYGRSGRAASRWPFLLVRYCHPCSVCHHSVTRMAVGLKRLPRVKAMKRQIQVRTSASTFDKKYIEHTPVYDLEAYEKRLKQRKIQQFLKSLLANSFILSTFVLTFSLLFIGE